MKMAVQQFHVFKVFWGNLRSKFAKDLNVVLDLPCVVLDLPCVVLDLPFDLLRVVLDLPCVVLDLPIFVLTAAPCVFDDFRAAANDLLCVVLDLPCVVLDLPSCGS